MDKNLDIITYAITLIIKSAIMAARFSARVRKRSLKRLAAMDTDTRDKEIVFLKDKICQLEMQVSVLQKRIHKRQIKPRYALREKLFILWHIETFGIARRRVTERLASPDPLFTVGSIRSMIRGTPEFQLTRHLWKSQFWSGKSRNQTLIGDVFALPINWHC